jgi:hypothetical protein
VAALRELQYFPGGCQSDIVTRTGNCKGRGKNASRSCVQRRPPASSPHSERSNRRDMTMNHRLSGFRGGPGPPATGRRWRPAVLEFSGHYLQPDRTVAMNCLAHAWRFLDGDPYFVTGTVLPDWLTMIARKTRVRSRSAMPFASDNLPVSAELARGILRHHRDDHWFHNNRGFVELNLRFSVELRDLLGADAGFRPHLAGHIVIEILLDSYLAEQNIQRLDRFYELVSLVDPARVQSVVNRIASVPTDRMADFVPRFLEEAYLYDYLENPRVRYRLNRVLNRVGLPQLPREFEDWLVGARKSVYAGAKRMLHEPGQAPFLGN